SQRQSGELFQRIVGYYDRLGQPVSAVQDSAVSLGLANGSRLISLPENPETIRCFSSVNVLIIDEAARVADEMLAAVRPMLSVSRGKLIALSTPRGKRGWFYSAWTDGSPAWHRVQVRATECPRISPEF